MAILSVNAGSSSLKFALYPLRDGVVQPVVMSGNIQGLEPGGDAQLEWRHGTTQLRQALPAGEGSAFERALGQLRMLLASATHLPPIQAVAHRVVHGGRSFRESVIVAGDTLERLERLHSLAPLHQSHNVMGIRSFQAAFADLPQIACFDTAFHASIPEVDYGFALPQALADEGVRRYGFHGLSYQFISDTLLQHSARAQGRVLMAHLGNGASLCAAVGGKSRASTMGFSALDGLMMGTRSGSLDAGVLLYLMEQGWDHDRIQSLLYKQSGLLGVSGISADMRRLRVDDSEGAKRAIAMFTHRVVRESGAMVACMGGLDAMAFSGGIGEHDAVLRAEACERLAWLGLRIDAERNAQAVGDEVRAIHTEDSAVEVWVVPTDEGCVAAREAAHLLALDVVTDEQEADCLV
jgi:acetate kinase